MSTKALADCARRVFGQSLELVDVRWGEGSNASFLVRDDYGKVVFEVTQAGLLNDSDLAERLEGHKRYREENIAEWELLRKWGHEIASLLSGKTKDGPERKLEWLPKLMLERFDRDFEHDMPLLRKFVAAPTSVDRDALIDELTTLPKTWSKE